MREIKFRGIDVRSKKFVYGNYQHQKDPSDKYHWICDTEMVTYMIKPSTLGQSIGLCGKEIYEGDIVIWDDELEPSEVYFNEITTQFTTKKRWLWTDLEHIKVIGNIHENPELLEVSK